MMVHAGIAPGSASEFPLTLWLIGQCPNVHETIVPKALKRRLGTLIFVLIEY